MDVSVIIVNYKTKQLTLDAIQSVFDKTEAIDYEIIVVDNDSQDGSIEHLQDKFNDRIEIINAGSNLGFGKANNLALKKAKGKYVFLLNSDTQLLNNAIKIFFDYMETDLNAGICCGNLYDLNNKPNFSFSLNSGSIMSYFLDRIFRTVDKLYFFLTKKNYYHNFNYTQKIKKVGYIAGADMFIRKSVLSFSGMFDEDIFMYGDDIDLSHRIKKSGYELVSIPCAKIMHIMSASFKKGNVKAGFDNYAIWKNGDYLLYFKMYGSKTIILYIESQISNILKLILSFIFSKKIFEKFFAHQTSASEYRQMFKINKQAYLKAKKTYFGKQS